MNNPEQSQFSRSVPESTTGNSKALIEGSSHAIDKLFPIFDQMKQFIKLPTLLLMLFYVFLMFQIQSINIYQNAAIKRNFSLHHIHQTNIVLWVFMFCKLDPTPSDFVISFIICLAFVVLLVGIIAYQLSYYKNNHRLPKIALYVTAFLSEGLLLIFLLPMAYLTGTSFLAVYNNVSDPVWWTLFVFSLLLLLLTFIYFLLFTLISSNSTYMKKYPLLCFETYQYIGFISLSVLTTVIVGVIQIYPGWMPYVYGVIEIAACVVLFIYTLRLPFYRLQTNATFLSLQLSFIMNEILINTITKYISRSIWYEIATFLATFIIGSICTYAYTHFRIKKIKEFMDKDVGDDQINNYFIEEKIDTSESKALLYLNIGLINGCLHLYDRTLMKFILTNHHSNHSICKVIQILAFFPSELRFLSYTLQEVSKRKDLTVYQRFLIYEVYRIKLSRQASVSGDASDRLQALKATANQISNELSGFWFSPDINIAFTEQYARRVEAQKALWDECIRDYPNNSKMSIEYAHFLVECATSFDEAIYQYQRANWIDAGTSFARDNAYRFAIRSFPVYFKNKIYDAKGNLLKKKNGITRQVSTTSVSNGISTGSMDHLSTDASLEIDVELMDSITAHMFRQGQLRMVLHHSIEDRKTCSMQYIMIVMPIVCLISIALFVACFFIIREELQLMRTSMTRLRSITKVRFYIDMAEYSVFLRGAKIEGLIANEEEFLNPIRQSEVSELRVYIDLLIPIPPQLMNYTVLAEDALTNLLTNLGELAAGGVNVYATANQLLNQVTNLTYCINSNPIRPAKVSLNELIVLMELRHNQIAGFPDDMGTIFDNAYLCECFSTHTSFMKESDSLFTSFYVDEEKRGLEVEFILIVIISVFTSVTFLLAFIPIIILIAQFVIEMRQALRALKGINEETRADAILPIIKDNTERSEPAETQLTASAFVWLTIFIVAISLVIVIMMLMMSLTSYFTCNEIINQNAWLLYAANRLTGCTAASLRAAIAVVSDNIDADYLSMDDVIADAIEQTAFLEQANSNMMSGVGSIPGAFGYDDVLDSYNVESSCTLNDSTNSGIHGIYMCASAIQQINIFSDMVLEVVSHPESFGGAINNEMAFNLIHISVSHIFGQLSKSIDRLVELCEITYNSMLVKAFIYMAVGIIFNLISIYTSSVIKAHMESSYSTIKILIKRISPTLVMQNKDLVKYILRKSAKTESTMMTISESVIHNSVSGIVCTGLTGTVEIANPTVTSILGYTPEQILGQPLSSIMTKKDATTLYNQMELMRNGQSATTYESMVEFVDDSDQEMKCSLVLLGMKDAGSSKVSSFVVIFNDETELLAQQKEAEEAKAKSENLLYQILPRAIVLKLNEGEKDICFAVSCSTVIFIDIVRFSDYAKTLTPEEIMGNLSEIFNAFDACAAHYPLITKIKLIGDVYMAAAGLFQKPEEDKREQALQTVAFSFDCLARLDEINLKLNSNLAVRIGLNSGPVIAGVLGTDKPVFDIIGDTINVSSRLQSTDIPGRVQISQATKELLAESQYIVEERGEIFLKGKGQQLTYFVSEVKEFMGQVASADVQTNRQ